MPACLILGLHPSPVAHPHPACPYLAGAPDTCLILPAVTRLPWLECDWPGSFPFCLPKFVLLGPPVLVGGEGVTTIKARNWPGCSLPGGPQKKLSCPLASRGSTILRGRTMPSWALLQGVGLRVVWGFELRQRENLCQAL